MKSLATDDMLFLTFPNGQLLFKKNFCTLYTGFTEILTSEIFIP
jgi:hypothetical protein